MAFLTSWSWDPYVLLGLLVTATMYWVGWRRLARLGGEGKGAVLPGWRVASFYAGLAMVWLALFSPVGVYTELFFFMHMIQHLLLVEVAAPLILLGAPLLPMMWSLPRGPRVGLGSLFAPGPVKLLFTGLTHPLVAVAQYCTVISSWHIPVFYDAAQGRTVVHDLEHAIFLGSALLFWWPVIHPAGGRRRLSFAAGTVYFMPVVAVGSMIGALLTFARQPLYATYARLPRVWGISVVQDQQLAGLIMWVPGGLVFLVPMLIFLVLLFRESSGDEAFGGPPDG